MERWKKWVSIIAMMLTALVMGGKSARAEGLLVEHDGVPTFQPVPLDERCMLSGHARDRVCSRVEGVLRPATQTQRQLVRAAVRDRLPVYQAVRRVAALVRELRCNTRRSEDGRCESPNLNRMHVIRVEARALIAPMQGAACGPASSLDACIPVPDTTQIVFPGGRPVRYFHQGQNLAEALDAIQARLEQTLGNAACAAGCMTQDDREFCERYALGELSTYDYTHPFNQTGGAQRCNDSADRECRARVVSSLSIWSCTSLRDWRLNASTVVDAMTAQRERARQDEMARVQQAQAMLAFTVQLAELGRRVETRPTQAPSPDAALVARVATLERDVEEFKRQARAQRPIISRIRAPARARRTATRPTSTTPTFVRECTPSTEGVSVCRVPAHNGGLNQILAFARLQGADGPAIEGLASFTRHMDDSARALVQQMLVDNAQGHSPLIFYCRRANGSAFMRRAGVHRLVNGNSEPMTPARFVEVARAHCGDTPRVGVWGVSNHLIRLRFRPDTARIAGPLPNRMEASRRGSQRNVPTVANYGPPSPPRDLAFACYAEVRAFASMPRSLDRNDRTS